MYQNLFQMKNTIIIYVISLFIFSCGNPTPKEKSIESADVTDQSLSTDQSATIEDHSKIGRINYAIMWEWTTSDIQLVTDNSPVISKELTKLWEDGVVENAYYNTDSPTDKLEYFPNIAFFLKSHSMEEAELVLNQLTVVKKGIATYKMYPVGHLWLDRKTEAVMERGTSKSFATVWETVDKAKITDEILKAQFDEILREWELGAIENVYFDIEGTQKANAETDFVFFVNANTNEEAEEICKSLPFYKEGIATYKMYEAGVFWVGKNESE